METATLQIENLHIGFEDEDGRMLPAVQGVSLSVPKGSIFCLVGESGCGKSLTAKACLQLLPKKAKVSGTILLNGTNLLALPEKSMQRIRGSKVAMIFQEPMTALNPVLTAGSQTMEPLILHLGLSKKEAKARVIELFSLVGIPSPEERFESYPHELSGGMRQRVMIAMALACEPDLLLADEPTTALDPTIQQQILGLIKEQSQKRGMSVLFITHDLGVAASMGDFAGAMYAGTLVESGPAQQVLSNPWHPYSQGLLACVPTRKSINLRRLPVIAGSVPRLGQIPSGCPFHPRCPKALPLCGQAKPEIRQYGNRSFSCHREETAPSRSA